MMHPYWINIEGQLGVGITARSDEDATMIFEAAFGLQISAGQIRAIGDMNELDQGHVIPNMGNWLKRGIWFPLGYEDISN
jgi:hypothetical protein